MAIYHCQVKPVSRGKGQSATAGAAYRSCSKIRDERTGEVFDYTRKRGLVHAEIVLSTEATKQDIQWARNREGLWNAAEAAEARKDARVAREYELALPHELNKEQRIELARAFAKDIANRYQCAVDFAVHKPHRNGDERNFHAHVYATTRQVRAAGLGEKTYIERSDTDRAKLGLGPAKNEITTIRERWAELANGALEKANHAARVDHRSLEAQGIDRVPTRHQGPAIRGIEARGERSIVVERIRAEEASARLAKAAEIGRMLAVSKQLRASVLDLSGSVARATQARDKALTPDEIQKGAREKWLRYREQQAERGQGKGADEKHTQELERTRDKKRDHTPEDDFSL